MKISEKSLRIILNLPNDFDMNKISKRQKEAVGEFMSEDWQLYSAQYTSNVTFKYKLY